MEQISFNLEKYKKPTKLAAHEFQDRAAVIADYLKAGKKRSSVFKAVKENRSKAESVFRYMKERGIHSVNYFFKVMNI